MTTVALLPNQPIKLRLPDDPVQFNLRVLDAQGHTLVVRVPESLAALDDPDEVELSFGYRNHYWQGAAQVKAVFDRWWFLAPPDEGRCQAVQRRSFVRVSFQDTLVAIPTSPLGEPLGDPATVTIANLSAGGCLVQMPIDLAVGDHILLVLALPGMPINPVFSAIVRKGASGDGGTWYGVRFESLDDRSQEELVHFVTGYIKERLREGLDVTQPEYQA